jgi:hypothetical protein
VLPVSGGEGASCSGPSRAQGCLPLARGLVLQALLTWPLPRLGGHCAGCAQGTEAADGVSEPDAVAGICCGTADRPLWSAEFGVKPDAAGPRLAAERFLFRCVVWKSLGTAEQMRHGRAAARLERAAGIEPASLAWKAKVLPLHNARVWLRLSSQLGGFQDDFALASYFSACSCAARFRARMCCGRGC